MTDLSLIAMKLGLRRHGNEYKGPCPCCGGTDRFHIRHGHSQPVLYHCRQGCSFAEISRALGLEDSNRYRIPDGKIVTPTTQTAEDTRASNAWSLATEAPKNHPYLLKKRIQPFGIRVVGTDFKYAPKKVRGKGNLLVIPAYRAGHLVAIQYIAEDGTRAWQAGCKATGAVFTFVGNGPVWVVEGFATGASLHDDTGHSVIVAFSASQISSAVRWARTAFSNNSVRVMADDDTPGHKAGIAAGAECRIPDFKGLAREPGDNDYNDFVRLRDG